MNRGLKFQHFILMLELVISKKNTTSLCCPNGTFKNSNLPQHLRVHQKFFYTCPIRVHKSFLPRVESRCGVPIKLVSRKNSPNVVFSAKIRKMINRWSTDSTKESSLHQGQRLRFFQTACFRNCYQIGRRSRLRSGEPQIKLG